MNKEYYNGFLRPYHLTAKNTGLRHACLKNVSFGLMTFSCVSHNNNHESVFLAFVTMPGFLTRAKMLMLYQCITVEGLLGQALCGME